MQVVIAEGLEIRQPLIAAIDGLREYCLSREDGVSLLCGQLSGIAMRRDAVHGFPASERRQS